LNCERHYCINIAVGKMRIQ